MARPNTGLRNASGLGFSRECAPLFYFSFAGLLLSAITLLATETYWRLPDLLGNYMVEATSIVLAPILTLMAADQLTLGAYQRTWFELKNQGRAMLLLEKDSLAIIRRDLAWHPLLRWARPSPQEDFQRHLRTAAQWYDALLSPEDAPWLVRYGAPLVTSLALTLTLLAPLLVGGVLAYGVQVDRSALLGAVILGCAALGTLCVSQLRMVARRQAILDYFTAYRD